MLFVVVDDVYDHGIYIADCICTMCSKNVDNSSDNLRHPRSVAYSVELVLMNNWVV